MIYVGCYEDKESFRAGFAQHWVTERNAIKCIFAGHVGTTSPGGSAGPTRHGAHTTHTTDTAYSAHAAEFADSADACGAAAATAIHSVRVRWHCCPAANRPADPPKTAASANDSACSNAASAARGCAASILPRTASAAGIDTLACGAHESRRCNPARVACTHDARARTCYTTCAGNASKFHCVPNQRCSSVRRCANVCPRVSHQCSSSTLGMAFGIVQRLGIANRT